MIVDLNCCDGVGSPKPLVVFGLGQQRYVLRYNTFPVHVARINSKAATLMTTAISAVLYGLPVIANTVYMAS